MCINLSLADYLCRDTQKEVSSLKRVFQHAENDMIQVSSICRELDDAKRKLALYESSEDNGLVKLLDVKIEELRIMKLKESQSVQVGSAPLIAYLR